MNVTLPYPPSINHYWRRVGNKTLISRQGRQYKHDAALSARAAGLTPLTGPVTVTLTVYRPRRSGDLDNVQKPLLDALNGIAWNDDSQVVELHAYRKEDKLRPRAEVAIEAALGETANGQ